MNWDTIKGNWKQWMGSVKSEWGKLTNDEIQQANGEREKMVGLIQEKYGKTKDAAEKEVDSFFSKPR